MCIYTHPPNQPLLVLVPLLGSWRNRQRWHFQLLGLAKRAEISWQILHQRLDVNQQISHGKNQRLDVNQQISHGKMKGWKIYGKMYPSIFCQPLGYIWYIDGYWKNKKPRFEWRLKNMGKSKVFVCSVLDSEVYFKRQIQLFGMSKPIGKQRTWDVN